MPQIIYYLKTENFIFMNSILKHRFDTSLTLLFLFFLTNLSFAQTTQIVLTETETDATVGLDRKAFNGLGNTSDHSEGYAHDFTLPSNENECQTITGVSIQVVVSGFNNGSGCVHPTLYYNLYYGCSTYNGGATCLPATNLLAEPNFAPGQNSPLFNYGNPFGSPLNGNLTPEFGGNLSVDVVPVTSPGCNAISNGLSYQYTITVTITLEDNSADVPTFNEINPICSGETLNPLPTTSNNDITGTWSPELNNTETTTYTFTPDEEFCVDAVELTIEVLTIDVESIAQQIPNDLSVSCDEDIPDFEEINLSDTCGIETIETEEYITEGNCVGELTITRTWNLLDFEGDVVASFEQVIEVTDTTAPEFVGDLPQDMTLSCSDEMPEIPELNATDNCSDVSITVDQIIIDDIDCAQNFTLQTIFTATDACGNFSTHEQNIQFLDTEGPVFETGIITELTLECGAPIPSIEPNVTHSCSDEVSFSFTDEVSDNCEGGKETIRTWEATDNCGNTSFLSIRYIEFCEPIVYQGISPNNDGINDHLEIERINCFPDNNFKVYNRYGRKVFNATNYDNSSKVFEGNDDGGNTLVTGTYFYVLNYRTNSNAAYTNLKGWIYINREP